MRVVEEHINIKEAPIIVWQGSLYLKRVAEIPLKEHEGFNKMGEAPTFRNMRLKEEQINLKDTLIIF